MALETYSYAFFLDLGKKLTAPIVDKIIERVSKKHLRLLSKSKFLKASHDFLAASYQKCSCVNTIVYPGEFKKIEDIYVPLTIQSDEGDVAYKVDDVIDVFHHGNKVFIKDNAGMGKTTISKRIFLNLVHQGKYTPVFIELRNLNDECIVKQVLEMMGLLDSEIDDEFIKSMGFAFILDGLDEIPHSKKQSIAKRILDFSDRFNDEKILITSRDEDVTNLFYSFAAFKVCPLEKDESLDVIRKIAKDSEIADRLVIEINSKKDDTIDEFLTTPLYVCLLFSVYRHRSKIPSQKHVFYANVYDALFNHHDATSKGGFFREKYSALDSSAFEVVLRRLAFYCLRKGQVEFSVHELRTKVHEIIEKIDFISCSSQDYVKDLTETVPLFQKEGQTVRWSHKSLMEYFAASFVYRDTKDKNQPTLLALYGESSSGELDNFFDIYANEDTEGFKRTVVDKVLSDFIVHVESSFPGGGPRSIPKQSVDIRRFLTFGCGIEFFVFGAGEQGHKKFAAFMDKIFKSSNADKIGLSSLRIVAISPKPNVEEGQRITVAINTVGGEAVNILPVVKKVCPDVFLTKEGLVGGANHKESFLNNFASGKSYKISEKPHSFCNLKKNFEAVNELLLITTPHVIDYSSACKEIGKIRSSRDSLDSWIDELV